MKIYKLHFQGAAQSKALDTQTAILPQIAGHVQFECS
jgi:hypothetical protein